MDCFFVVTRTSVYKVYRDQENSQPCMEKIHLFGQSQVPVGHKGTNTMIGITRACLVAYTTDKKNSPPGMVNTKYWGNTTSAIVAIFPGEAEAMECSRQDDLKPWDKRWSRVTKETLAEIREECSFCKVDHDVTD